MIFNLSTFIKAELGVTPIVNGLDENNTNGLFLTQTGGGQTAVIATKRPTVQIIVRDESRYQAKKSIEEAYSVLNNRYSLTLPEVTIEGDLYPEITAFAINSLQMPGYIGTDKNGLHMWSVNFQVTL